MIAPPMYFQWDGEAMVPRSQVVADQSFVIGQFYRMVEHEDRSDASHKHEFAFIREAWRNLPEDLAPLYPSPDHLRKRALIQAGFFDEQVIDAGSNVVAVRIAAYARQVDDFALIYVRDNIVVIRTAKSQSHRAMNKEQWQASKTAVLEIVSAMIGVEPGELSRAA